MTSDRAPFSILFLIRRLDAGGAERQLVTLAQGLAAVGHRVAVISLYPGGALEGELSGTGVRLMSAEKRGRWHFVAPLVRLARLLRQERPQILHSYLPVANILGLMLRPLVPGLRVVWGLRGTLSDAQGYDRLRGLSFALERRLSKGPDLIIANSDRGRRLARDWGYPAGRLIMVPNGIDTSRFKPDPRARAQQRAAWRLADEAPVVGIVARIDPMKDYDTFLAAARIAATQRDDLRFVVIGDGPPDRRRTFDARVRQLGLDGRVLSERFRPDIEAVYNALDIATLTSSHGEGFPNVLAEAMACGIPCVSTDVGDAAQIIGEADLIVRPRDAAALAHSWLALLDRLAEDPELKATVRQRVIDDFGEAAMIERSAVALRSVLQPAPHRA